MLPSVSGEAAASRRAGLLRAHALLLTHAPVDAPRPPHESALFDACFRALLAGMQHLYFILSNVSY